MIGEALQDYRKSEHSAGIAGACRVIGEPTVAIFGLFHTLR